MSDALDRLRDELGTVSSRAGDVVGAALADNNVAEILTLQSGWTRQKCSWNTLSGCCGRRTIRSGPSPLSAACLGLRRGAARSDEALRLQTEALERFRELGAQDNVVDSLVRLVEIHVLAGEQAADCSARRSRRGTARGWNASVTSLCSPAPWRGSRPVPGVCRVTRRAPVPARRGARLAIRDGFDYEVALASLASDGWTAMMPASPPRSHVWRSWAS